MPGLGTSPGDLTGAGGTVLVSWRSKLDELKDSYNAVRGVMAASSEP